MSFKNENIDIAINMEVNSGNDSIAVDRSHRLKGSLSNKELIETAKKVLGDFYYRLLVDFHLSFICSTHNYKIIKTRRAFNLFQIFSRIILGDDAASKMIDNVNLTKELKYKGQVMTDVYLYNNYGKIDCKNNTVVIIDDILIHGRALSELVDYFEEQCDLSVQNIYVRVFAKFIDAEDISDSLRNCMKRKVEGIERFDMLWNSLQCDVVEWQTLSNAIVELLQRCGYAYASFTDSYDINKDISLDDLKWKFNILCKAEIPQTMLQEYTGMSQKLFIDDKLFSNFNKKNDVLKFFAKDFSTVLRSYTYKTIHGDIMEKIMPFALLPVLSIKRMNEIINELKGVDNNLCDVISEKNIINENDKIVATQKNILCYNYKLLTFLFSSYFIREKGLESYINNKKEIESCRLYSFNLTQDKLQKIYSYIDGKSISDAFATNEENFYNKLNLKNPWCESAFLFTKVLNKIQLTDVDSLCSALAKYIEEIHSVNEKRAKQQKPRLQGISIHNMFGIMYAALEKYQIFLTSMDWIYVLGVLINMWDCGIANYNVDVYFFNNTWCIDGCITDGEQAYHVAFDSPVYADFLVCAQMLTQGVKSIIYGIERLNAFEKKVTDLGLKPEGVDFKKIINYYKEIGTFNTLTHPLRTHRPSSTLMDIVFKI